MAVTALPPLAEVNDLRAWPGVSVSNDQEPAAEAVLSRASAVVRRVAGQTFLNDDGSELVIPDGVVGIVVESAARFWNNPSGATMIVKGPFSEQFSQAIEAGVFLTQTQKDDLAALTATTVARPKIWTLPTTRDECDTDLTFLYDQYGGDPIVDSGGVSRTTSWPY